MSGSLFGTDGIRGRVGREPISPSTILKLGWAAGTVLSEAGHEGKVLIGKDTRVSGYMLESALEAGFSSSGADVTLLGPMPTPGIAYLTRTARAAAGVVISASHNPFHDNGIKIFSSDGTKLNNHLVRLIDEKMKQPLQCVDSAQLGKAERLSDASGRYIEFCKSTFPETLTLDGLNIVVDCANGAAYDIAPQVFTELGANLTVIGNKPDGFNINRECGSTHLEKLTKKVLKVGADIGIALDGDADRVLMVDASGNVVDGDQMLYLLATHRQNENRLVGGVAGTVMTNLGIELALKSRSIPFVRTKVGDKYVHDALCENEWALGGESSGHIICLDKQSTGDGIVAALEVMQTMIESDKTLEELTSQATIFPQRMINVELSQIGGSDIVNNKEVRAKQQAVEAELGSTGRVVLRPSGTEPLVRVMIEGEDRDQVYTLTEQLANSVQAIVSQESG